MESNVVFLFQFNTQSKVNENCGEREKKMTKVKHSFITRLGEKSIKNQGFETDMGTDSRNMNIEPIQ